MASSGGDNEDEDEDALAVVRFAVIRLRSNDNAQQLLSLLDERGFGDVTLLDDTGNRVLPSDDQELVHQEEIHAQCEPIIADTGESSNATPCTPGLYRRSATPPQTTAESIAHVSPMGIRGRYLSLPTVLSATTGLQLPIVYSGAAACSASSTPSVSEVGATGSTIPKSSAGVLSPPAAFSQGASRPKKTDDSAKEKGSGSALPVPAAAAAAFLSAAPLRPRGLRRRTQDDTNIYVTCRLCRNKILASRASNLHNHVRRHATMKQFQCCYCEYMHNEIAKVRLHMGHNHKDPDSQPVNNLSVEMQSVWDSLLRECFPGYARDQGQTHQQLLVQQQLHEQQLQREDQPCSSASQTARTRLSSSSSSLASFSLGEQQLRPSRGRLSLTPSPTPVSAQTAPRPLSVGGVRKVWKRRRTNNNRTSPVENENDYEPMVSWKKLIRPATPEGFPNPADLSYSPLEKNFVYEEERIVVDSDFSQSNPTGSDQTTTVKGTQLRIWLRDIFPSYYLAYSSHGGSNMTCSSLLLAQKACAQRSAPIVES